MGKVLALLLIILLALALGAGYLFLTEKITAGERQIADGQRQLEQGQSALEEGKAKGCGSFRTTMIPSKNKALSEKRTLSNHDFYDLNIRRISRIEYVWSRPPGRRDKSMIFKARSWIACSHEGSFFSRQIGSLFP